MYQVRTYLEMMQMGYKEWQDAMQKAKDIVAEVRREYKAYLESGDKSHSDKANELKDKANAKVEGGKKAYFTALRKEVLDKTDALYEKLSEVVKKATAEA